MTTYADIMRADMTNARNQSKADYLDSCRVNSTNLGCHFVENLTQSDVAMIQHIVEKTCLYHPDYKDTKILTLIDKKFGMFFSTELYYRVLFGHTAIICEKSIKYGITKEKYYLEDEPEVVVYKLPELFVEQE